MATTRIYGLLFSMINSGELSVADAKAELAARPFYLDAATTDLLARWVMDCTDRGLGDDYRATDAISTPDDDEDDEPTCTHGLPVEGAYHFVQNSCGGGENFMVSARWESCTV